ncbi:serine/threonine-protein kinase Sgk2 [Xylariaceae sp. FL1651]|nr:serine/threonine-protein kinase Sgk2 [Xylariaceae sp. FL1651]
MTDQARLEIIAKNPIGKGLNTFRASYALICEKLNIPNTQDSLHQLSHDELQNITVQLLSALQILPAARLLRSNSGRTLFSELPRLYAAVTSDDFDFDFNDVRPLLKAALSESPDDVLIWDQVCLAVTESTPPPRTIASFQQTPWVRNTSSFPNSSEYRQDVNKVPKEELGSLFVGLPDFFDVFFGRVANLREASEAAFQRCLEGDSPLFAEGWREWPEDANQDDVLSWFADLSIKLAALAEEYKSSPTQQRRPLAQPNRPIQGSTAERKMDVGFVNNPQAEKDSRCNWAQILVPGELKSNPSADIASKAWLDIGTYAREVLAAQYTRRFVLGFTICGSLMRIWEFDRLGGVASEQFDINKDGQLFVFTILGFLWMNEEELGFDPTIITANGQRFIDIERNGSTERVVIDKVMIRARCIAGRATTCWKAHREGEPQAPLVIKDSWQYVERDEEGELLREATNNHVFNVARYYHHETVHVSGKVDDIQVNIRRDMDITRAKNYRTERPVVSPSSSHTKVAIRKGRSSSTAGTKRSSSQTGALLPPRKRPCSTSLTKLASHLLPNRVHRRIIIPMEGCIEGHESLRHKAELLHRDISVNNLMINEDNNNPSWTSFLIDLDLAVKEQREVSSGAKGKTGTRAFMAIGALKGQDHSFMHDLESFFWVLFWICIHYSGPHGRSRTVAIFDRWNYEDTEYLATLKAGVVANEGDFIKRAEEFFTSYYQPLVIWVNRLRKVVFPNGRRWEKEDEKLYSRMKDVLREARKDPRMLSDKI